MITSDLLKYMLRTCFISKMYNRYHFSKIVSHYYVCETSLCDCRGYEMAASGGISEVMPEQTFCMLHICRTEATIPPSPFFFPVMFATLSLV